MRLAPRSLFARMVLVLLAGLVIAQALSLAIHWRERGEFAQRAMGMRSVQRIADVVKLLDSMPAAERARIVSVLNSPPLRISLEVAPLAPSRDEGDKAELAAQFELGLRRQLGESWPLVVQVTDTPTWGPAVAGMKGPGYGRMGEGGPGMMGGKGMFGPSGYQAGRGGIAFIVQARLTDGALVTFDSRSPPESLSWPYRLLASLVILLVAVVALTLVAVRWVTRPLKTLAQAAEDLGRDINRPPLAEGGPLEVERAARAFNTMQRQLADYIRERTRIFAAMSHDLKTPITRLRLRAELLDDPELRAKFAKDLQDMEMLVSAALDFMRGLDNAAPSEPVDIGALLESLQEDTRETGGEVRIEGAALAPFYANPQAFKRCLGNLIENAVKYGQSATVIVDDTPQRLCIRVRDAGPGVPEAELDRLFEPFHRLEASRSRETGGTGLGLSIARNIARAYGGDITLHNLPEGGLEATLTLPRRNLTGAGSRGLQAERPSAADKRR